CAVWGDSLSGYIF
nr:immunoglobulin light chain junction region [Macaca mulatta]